MAEIRLDFCFSEHALHAYIKEVQQKFKSNIGSNEAQKLAIRAFQAVEKVHYEKAKKVRFKTARDGISVENKGNNTGLRYVDRDV